MLTVTFQYYCFGLPLLHDCMFYDWPKSLAPLSYSIRSKTKTNHDLLACVFPHLYLPQVLVRWIVCIPVIGQSDCLKSRFWFHDTQRKTAATAS